MSVNNPLVVLVMWLLWVIPLSLLARIVFRHVKFTCERFVVISRNQMEFVKKFNLALDAIEEQQTKMRHDATEQANLFRELVEQLYRLKKLGKF